MKVVLGNIKKMLHRTLIWVTITVNKQLGHNISIADAIVCCNIDALKFIKGTVQTPSINLNPVRVSQSRMAVVVIMQF